MTFSCKFCGCDLTAGTGKKFAFPIYRSVHGGGAVDEHGTYNSGWCRNRAGALTYHHPDSPEFNGGIDYSDGRALA